MARIHLINAGPLTAASFEQFGELLDVPRSDITGRTSYPVNFEGGKIRISTAQLPYKALQLTGLEQHYHLTQAFIPICGSPAVFAVAKAGFQTPIYSVPEPDDIRAFVIDGTKGHMLKKGIWHSNRLPLHENGSKMVIITDKETSFDLKAHESMSSQLGSRDVWNLYRIIGYQQLLGIVLQIEV